MATPLPENHAAFTMAELLAATGGELVSGSAEGVTHVSTNTRDLQPGAVFVALRGKVHDGHAHVAEAAAAGARVVVVDAPVQSSSAAVVRVDCTLRALGDLARAHVTRWQTEGERRLIGITGSAGKTTTRVATAALIAQLFPGALLATRGNLNNRIGVPMMLFSLDARHRAAVLELGTSERGEIAALAKMVQPDVGILTLVAEAHLEGLGSLEGVAEEKGALLRALPHDGMAVGNADDVRVARLLADAPCATRIDYGRSASAEVRVAARSPMGMTRSRVELAHADGRAVCFETPLVGEAGALACAAAVATVEATFARHLEGAWLTQAFDAVDVSLGAQRLVPHVFASGLAVIDDTYNANPVSMCASIQAAAEMASAMERRLVLVLGEMRELGSEAARGHDRVGHAAAESGAAHVFAVTGEAERIASRVREAGLEAQYSSSVEQAIDAVQRVVTGGDLVLVKASRSVGAQRIVVALGER